METLKDKSGQKAESLPAPQETLPDNIPLQPVVRPLPGSIRYIMLGFLVIGVTGAVIFAYLRQAPPKPVASNLDPQNCADPVTENRLRDTLSKSPNDFGTLMDWGDYNLNCAEPRDYASAIAAFQGATRLASNIPGDNRVQAHFNLGLAYLYNRSLKDARDEFQLILNEQPQNSSALFLLGASLTKDDPQQALVYLKKAVEVAPGGAVAGKAQELINEITSPKTPPSPATLTPGPGK